VPGTAIHLTPGKETTPLALRAEVVHNHVLHEKVLIVSVESVGVPHVEDSDRFESELMGHGLFKITHVSIRTGYHDRGDVPKALAQARKEGHLPRNLDLEHASYFVSRMTIVKSDSPGMGRWRKSLFIFMARNATSPIVHFRLPGDRTVIMGKQVGL
jgi:KUP system potassium uptake protein